MDVSRIKGDYNELKPIISQYKKVLVTGLINGDTSEVTILTNGQTYNIGDLSRGDVDLDDSVVEEIGYELSDVIREYFDKVGSLYSVDGDMIDYQVVSDEKFKSAINPLTK